ncbi:MAG: hypothetical protein Q7J16_07750, partial [Candidatus Cloacimonadales bacterium]|nr:hypothetical protein [Candidatus Cloacimonadales bacterium]
MKFKIISEASYGGYLLLRFGKKTQQFHPSESSSADFQEDKLRKGINYSAGAENKRSNAEHRNEKENKAPDFSRGKISKIISEASYEGYLL